MSKKTLFTIAIATALLGAGMAHAAPGSACMSNPAGANAAISAELAGIANLSGDARRSALDAFVLDAASVKGNTRAGACAAAAIQQAAQLYTNPQDQQRVAQIAASLGTPQTQTAALDDGTPTGGRISDGSRGSDN